MRTSQVARDIGTPWRSRRCSACATNPVCLVIPCHRVVGKDGSLTGYRWGVERKKRLLANEKINQGKMPVHFASCIACAHVTASLPGSTPFPAHVAPIIRGFAASTPPTSSSLAVG